MGTVVGIRTGEGQPGGEAVEDDIVEHDNDGQLAATVASARLGLVDAAGGAGESVAAAVDDTTDDELGESGC